MSARKIEPKITMILLATGLLLAGENTFSHSLSSTISLEQPNHIVMHADSNAEYR